MDSTDRSPLHIVHVYDGHEKVYDGRGSVPGVVWNLARETAANGHRVTVLERQWDGLDTRSVHDGVDFRRIPVHTGSSEPWTDVPYEMVSTPTGATRLLADRTNFAVQALRVLRTLDYDVIHVHLPFAGNVMVTVAPWIRDSMVYTAHIGEIESRVLRPRFSPDVYIANRIAETIVLNPDMKTAFEYRGVSSDRMTVVPNGVEIDRFQNIDEPKCTALRDKYDLAETQVVLFVGTVTPRKGVTELVEAWEQVIETSHDDTTLVIVGNQEIEPEYTASVRDRIEAAGIDDRVRFTGFVPEEEIPVLYQLAELFVLPSYEEGSSIAVTEAIASQTPVVGSRIDGINQQIDHGVHGFLVDPGDIDGLANAIERALGSDTDLDRMATALADRAVELSWPHVTDQIVDIYRGVAQ